MHRSLDERISRLAAQVRLKPRDRQARTKLVALVAQRDRGLQWDSLLKALYPANDVIERRFRAHPLLSMIRQDTAGVFSVD
jgi:hypothetical protein